nr:uncharacterized protein LOC128689628 [Cherax quadricarinatus]
MFCEEFKERASVVCKNPDSSNNSGLHNKTYEWKTAPSYTCHAFLLISLFLQVFFEINRAKKLQWHYLHSNFIFVRLPSLVLTTIVVIPTCSCEFLLGIKMVPIWQCGILALLLTWTQLLQIVNKLPQFTLFTITTWDFIKYYFKGLIYIIMVILLFGLIFHMLLHNQSAFSTMPQSVVKTVVWMLGDLAYDDTFVSGKPPYPILVNVLFLVFICTVAAFIVILLKAPSSNENEATLYKKAGQVNFLLNLDVYFPFLKRKYAVGKYNSKDAKPWIITKMKYVLKPKESLIASKLSEHLDNAALMNINKYRDNNKHYIQLKIEELFNLFNDYADEGENFLLPDPQQDHLNTHTKKLDQLLTLCQQLNENYQKQNEQLLELKQQLDNMKQGSRNRLY